MSDTRLLALAGLGGAVVGSIATYFLMKKRLHDSAEEYIAKEIADFKDGYDVRKEHALMMNEAQKEALGVYMGIVKDYEDKPPILVDGEPINPEDYEEVEIGRPEETEEAWEEELELRDRTKPYIISKDEFFENEPGHEQGTYVYFEGDDILIDKETDQVVDDVERLIGDDNLHFGTWSKDNMRVYIRNEEEKLDFDIVENMGSYAESVLGIDIEEPVDVNDVYYRMMRRPEESD